MGYTDDKKKQERAKTQPSRRGRRTRVRPFEGQNTKPKEWKNKKAKKEEIEKETHAPRVLALRRLTFK